MGQKPSRVEEAGQTPWKPWQKRHSLSQEVISLLPPATFDDDMWMANCLKINSQSKFAAEFCLYQPDCRLFCDKGMDCKFLKTPAPEGAEAHRQSFIHVSPDVLSAAAAADMEQRGATEVMNLATASWFQQLLPGSRVLLPFIDKCWVMPTNLEDLEGTSTSSSFPKALKGAQVVVLVPGFRTSRLRALRTAWVLRNLTADAPQRTVVLSFVWPSHRHRKSYAKARTHSSEAGPYLASLLRVLAQLGCRVTLVAHSLGCRVALEALQKPVQVEYLAMLGAAVARDALEPQGEFPRSRLMAQSVDIFYSHKDSILSKYFKVGEGFHALTEGAGWAGAAAALGLAGPSASSENGSGSVSAFDVAVDVESHCAEKYLLSSSFGSRLALHLHCAKAPDLGGLQRKLTSELLTNSSEDSGDDSE